MNRRQALKNMGWGAGAILISSSTLSLLQSCKNEPEYKWEPLFLSAANGFALKQVLDVILPKTDTPGAKELNIPQFIDAYMDKVASKKQAENFKRSAQAFSRAFEKELDKEVGNGSPKEYESLVKKYLKATPAEKEEFIKRNSETQDPQDSDPKVKIDADAGAYSYLQSVRDLGIWAWKNSEQIGENVLWYDPIPGEYIPCGPVNELGGGKAMSL